MTLTFGLLTAGLAIVAAACAAVARRPFVVVHPRHAALLRELHLTHPDHFLSLRAVLVSGHPDRHVGQVALGPLRGFLKREHRVPWKDRFAAWWAGFGMASKSEREAQLLATLAAAGIGCPGWVAYGEDGRGRAFLLVEEAAGAVDLRLYLQDHLSIDPRQRRAFARRLGRELARLHEAGFDHPDLCAKHVLVRPQDQAIFFLDWQRGRRSRPRRLRNLAMLAATLADYLASPRERLVCLRAYKKRTQLVSTKTSCVLFLRTVAQRLRRRRHVREQLLPPLPTAEQNLIWLDGEALCVTREFWAALDERVPDWLTDSHTPPGVTRHCHQVAGLGDVQLVRRREWRPLGWLWSLLRRRPLTSPELRGAADLFRLQRRGARAPRLLAVGQRRPRPWVVESFLLTQPEGGPRP